MQSIEYLKQIAQSKGLNPLTNEIKDNSLMFSVGINAIYRDLIKLKKLNEVWHKNEPMESVDINANHLQEVYDFIKRLFEEIQKLEKAIDIFKRKMIIVKLRDNEYIIRGNEYITKEQYDLLKEVLQNE